MLTESEMDRSSRAELLKEQKAAHRMWRQVHFFQGMVIAWGESTKHVVEMMGQEGWNAEELEVWRDMVEKGRLSIKKTQNDIIRIDAYLRALDARLADGTKWYTAAEVSAFLNEGDEHEYRGSDQETPGL